VLGVVLGVTAPFAAVDAVPANTDLAVWVEEPRVLARRAGPPRARGAAAEGELVFRSMELWGGLGVGCEVGRCRPGRRGSASGWDGVVVGPLLMR
jgi:hypothetical protein